MLKNLKEFDGQIRQANIVLMMSDFYAFTIPEKPA